MRKSESIGDDTLAVEVLNISPHGFWLLAVLVLVLMKLRLVLLIRVLLKMVQGLI